MLNRHQRFGKKGESLAVQHLKQNGYRILEQNYRNPIGEIDIIAEHRGSIVFVEVKSRKTARFGGPKAAVTAAKQRKISMVALYYLKATRQSDARARFDVVTLDQGAAAPRVDIIRNAFELAYP